MPFAIGENVGSYRIVEQLGQGGMATVFKAYHAALDRYVAIKVLHPAFKEDPNFLARFQREARVVAKLEHPNIVPVYDYADHGGSPYLVMKFIEGETLKARLARGPLTLADGLQIIEAVGAGLSHAHRQGILHRDIKPSNVMLAKDGGMYLADFGLARIALAGESTLSADSMLGTPHYMSPEQAKGIKNLDAGTDIYSLGVVIYELVVGRVPYSADTPFAIIHDHIFTPLPMPRAINPNVPEALERFLLKALAKERADRFADAAQMVTAFREAVTPYLGLQTQAAAGPTITALPHTVPVSPSAETPPAPKIAETVAAATAPPPAPTAEPQPTARPEPAQKKKYQFRWWHALVAVVLVGCCCFLALAAANRNRPAALAATQAAQTAQAALGTGMAAAQTSVPKPGTPVVPPPATPGPVVKPTPVADDPQVYLMGAEAAFKESRLDDALASLDQAVAVDPRNAFVYLQAGDMALKYGHAMPALTRFYLPATELETKAADKNAQTLKFHAALAFYVLATQPNVMDFLMKELPTYHDPYAVQGAVARTRIFHGDAENALRDLESHLKEFPGSPYALLLVGDYYLQTGKSARAAENYIASVGAQADNPEIYDWLRVEARCNVEKIRVEKGQAKLTPTCADLSSLLTGK